MQRIKKNRVFYNCQPTLNQYTNKWPKLSPLHTTRGIRNFFHIFLSKILLPFTKNSSFKRKRIRKFYIISAAPSGPYWIEKSRSQPLTDSVQNNLSKLPSQKELRKSKKRRLKDATRTCPMDEYDRLTTSCTHCLSLHVL